MKSQHCTLHRDTDDHDDCVADDDVDNKNNGSSDTNSYCCKVCALLNNHAKGNVMTCA